MRKYDLVISLGSGCPTADALKQLKITEKTYPFDWSDCDGDASEKLLKKCNLIKNHFENAFNLEDFVERWTPERQMRGVKNKKTGLHYWHDFPWEKSLKDHFQDFSEKYQRRVNRLYDDVETSKSILFVFEDMSKLLPIPTIKTAIKILKETFPTKDINLLVILPILKDQQYQEINLGVDGVFVVACSGSEKSYLTEVAFLKRLITQFFGLDYYSFSHDDKIIAIGLSQIEDFGRWSATDDVFFRLYTKLKSEYVSVAMNIMAYVNDLQPTQKCKIICNGHEISEMVFDKFDKQTINLIVPNDNDGNLDFVFEFDNPKSPKELGLSPDERKLGLGFIDAVISGE